MNYVMVDEDVPLIADGIVVEATRRKLDEPRIFIGIEYEVPVAEFTGGKAAGIDAAGMIWDELHRKKPDIPHLLPNGNELGVLYMGKAGKGFCTYVAGAEAAGHERALGYASFTLPCGEYAVCSLEAENFEELVCSAIFKASSFMSRWMKKHNLTCGDFAAEMYYDTSPDASYMELWLPLSTSHPIQKTGETWDRADGTRKPSPATISAYVNSPLFDRLCEHVETEYQSRPVLEYSRCSEQYGWNVKYKKAGRTLCTLYPMEGYFIALIVIGERERTETELILPSCTAYLQQLYQKTKTVMNQKWLMIDVKDDEVLEDVKQLIAIRRGSSKKK